ncbi:MAG: DUF3892 domain-containing protein [Candidatus Neomarinimicrobiota bacterium]
MANRNITHCQKNGGQELIALINDRAEWSPISINEIICDIEQGLHSYFLKIGFNRMRIVVIKDSKIGKYLTTDPESSDSNFLEDLPEF